MEFRYLLDTDILSNATRLTPSAALLAWMGGPADTDLFIAMGDAIIAAVAEANSCVVVTANEKISRGSRRSTRCALENDGAGRDVQLSVGTFSVRWGWPGVLCRGLPCR